MPLEDLTPLQKDFIRSFFKTGVKWKKNKKQQFNESLTAVAVSVYSKADEFNRKINEIESSSFGKYADIGLLREMIESTVRVFEQILIDNKSTIKQMKMPDFKAVTEGFKLAEMLISKQEEIARARELRAINGETNKEDFFNEFIGKFFDYNKEVSDLSHKAIVATKKSSKETIDTRNEKIKAYNDVYKEYLKKLNGEKSNITESSVELDKFELALNAIYINFKVAAKPKREDIEQLLNINEISKNDCDEFFLSKKGSMEVVKREDERRKAVQKLLEALLLSKAKKEKALKEKKEACRDSTDKDADRAAIKKLIEEIDEDIIKENQYRAFLSDDGKIKRVKRMIESERLLGSAEATAELIEGKLETDGFFKLAEYDDRLRGSEKPPIALFPSETDINKQVKEFKAKVDLSAETPITAERIYLEEPEMNQISEKQKDVLYKMFANIKGLVDNGNLQYASIVFHDAQQMWIAFILERCNGLPAPPSKGADPKDQLLALLLKLEGTARDLKVQGIVKKQDTEVDYLTRVATLRIQINDLYKDIVVTQESIPTLLDFKDISAAIDALEDDMSKEKPREEVTDKAELAKTATKNLNKKLLALYNTEEVTSPDSIPADQLLTVVEGVETKYYKILTKTGSGGKEVTRRSSKDIPREMMDFLKSRSDTLAMMSKITVEGCDEQIQAYITETQKFMDELAEAAPKYKQIEKKIKEYDKLFEQTPLNEFAVKSYGQIRTEWDAFKDKYKTMLPSDAVSELSTHTHDIDRLKSLCSEVKSLYEVVANSLRDAFFSITKPGDFYVDTVAEAVKDMLDSGIDTLLSNFTDKDNEEYKAAKQTIEQAKEKINSNSYFASKTTSLEGEWRKSLNKAYRLNELKTADGVEKAKEITKQLRLEMRDFRKKSKSILSSSDQSAVLEFIKDFASKIDDMAKGAEQKKKDKAEAEDLKSKIDQKIKELMKLIPKKSFGDKYNPFSSSKGGTDPTAVSIESRLNSVKDRLKPKWEELEKRQWWDEAITFCQKLQDELVQIEKDMPGSFPEREKIGKIKIVEGGSSSRFSRLETAFDDLKTEAHGLAAGSIRTKRSSTQELDVSLNANIDEVEKSLQKTTVFDLSKLKVPSVKIDTALGDLSTTKDERMLERENALKELRKVRRFFEQHPSIKLYAENPFDSGGKIAALKGALHNIEIAILTCVSHRES